MYKHELETKPSGGCAAGRAVCLCKLGGQALSNRLMKVHTQIPFGLLLICCPSVSVLFSRRK